jgi:NADH:ubiquinone oxidoreductase subunit F (NADH-binding)
MSSALSARAHCLAMPSPLAQSLFTTSSKKKTQAKKSSSATAQPAFAQAPKNGCITKWSATSTAKKSATSAASAAATQAVLSSSKAAISPVSIPLKSKISVKLERAIPATATRWSPPSSSLYSPLPFRASTPFYAPLRDLFAAGQDAFLSDLRDSKLRGRGGAGFPVHLKWQSCREATGSIKYIVCNADEGDPGAYIDKYLMEEQPHAVLLGMMVAGWFCGAGVGVLYIRAEYPDSITRINAAIDELKSAGWLGKNIQGSGFDFEFKTIKGAGAYICGEETALLASIEGQRPEVRVRPPFPTQEGLFLRPTVVNNVETFANLRPLLLLGGKGYAQIGTEMSTGPKLLSLDSGFNKPGIYEVAMGTPLEEVFDTLAGGFWQRVKAVQIGGPLGGIVPVSRIGYLTVDFESFKAEGFLLGHAGVVSIPERFPMIEYLQHLFQFTADESCGKCFPCRLGSTRGKELIAKARADASFKIDRELLDDLLETMELTSLCALGGGVPLPIKNALQHFDDELRGYFTHQTIPA